MSRSVPLPFLAGTIMLAAIEFSIGLNSLPIAVVFVASFLLIVSGLPHGALDVWISRDIELWRGWWSFILFHGAYVGIAAASFLAFILAPTLALFCFLALSIAHFADDWDRTLPFSLRLCLSLVTFSLPIVSHPAEVIGIFSLLLGRDNAVSSDVVGPFLHYYIPVVVGVFGAAALSQARSLFATSGVALAAICLPPLVFFGLYFALWHGLHHLQRHAASLLSNTRWGALALYSTIVLVIGVAAALLYPGNLQNLTTEDYLVKGVFWILGALTVPHMVLLWVAEGRTAQGQRAAFWSVCVN